jgi:hypothetical protein
MTRERLPNRRRAEHFEYMAGNTRYAAQVGRYADGRIAEVFLNAGKVGTEIDVIARDSAIAVSFALQHGVTADEIRSAFTRRPDGSAEGPLGILFDLLAVRRIGEAA